MEGDRRAGLLERLVSVKKGEGQALLLAFLYFFFLMAAYYILRPVRDEMGVRSGVRSLASLYTWTFVVSLVIAPIFALLVAKLRRRIFVPLVYGFLLLNILVFWGALTGSIALAFTAQAFFVWITVFVVFAVSVFWSFMADLFTGEQAKRLYPTIAAGGMAGQLAGSGTVLSLAKVIGPANLLLAAAVLLALAMTCAMRLDRSTAEGDAPQPIRAAEKAQTKIGGGILSGLGAIFSSPYLIGIAGWVFMLSLAGTLAYYQQTAIVGAANMESGARTEFFGRMDFTAGVVSLILQLFVTRWLIKCIGVGPTLAAAAAVFAVGLVALAAAPTLLTLFFFVVAQRSGTFALSNPARESLWAAATREDKYKAKNVVDNAVFRGSDVLNAWFYNIATGPALAASLTAISYVLAPVMALWALLSLWLGRRQARLIETASPAPVKE